MPFGFAGALALLFIALKLMGYIAWSWWLVLLPLWAGIALLFVAFVPVLIYAVMAGDR